MSGGVLDKVDKFWCVVLVVNDSKVGDRSLTGVALCIISAF